MARDFQRRFLISGPLMHQLNGSAALLAFVIWSLISPSRSSAISGFGGYISELTPGDAGSFDEFGYSVALDGALALVGGEDNDQGGSSAGGGYLFDATTGTQLRKFLANDAAAGDGLGYSSALDATAGIGGAAVLGAPQWLRNGARTGAAYLFNASTGAQVARLKANDGAQGDQFGVSVAIDGALIIVGARSENSLKENSGSAYLFDSVTGVQLRKLKAVDAGIDDQFGTSVDIDGNRAVVGAYLDDAGKGSAYIFDAGTGDQLRKLIPNDALGWTQFGVSVAIDNGVALIGARGARPDGVSTGVAYLFDVATGVQLAELYPPDGAQHDNFGSSVALDNGLAVIGALEHNAHGAQSGAAYIFDVATRQQLAKISPTDGAAGDLFGWSVSIDASPSVSGRVLVGARYGDAGAIPSGSAYLFDVARAPEPASIAMAYFAIVLSALRSRRRA